MSTPNPTTTTGAASTAGTGAELLQPVEQVAADQVAVEPAQAAEPVQEQQQQQQQAEEEEEEEHAPLQVDVRSLIITPPLHPVVDVMFCCWSALA